MFCDGCHTGKELLGNYLDYNIGMSISSHRLVKGFWQVTVYQNNKGEYYDSHL